MLSAMSVKTLKSALDAIEPHPIIKAGTWPYMQENSSDWRFGKGLVLMETWLHLSAVPKSVGKEPGRIKSADRIKPLHSPCRQKMDNGKIALTPNVEKSGMLGSTFGQNAGSIPALAIWERQEYSSHFPVENKIIPLREIP